MHKKCFHTENTRSVRTLPMYGCYFIGMQISGRIIEEQKNFYVVNTAQGDVRATRKGVLKKENKRICTGDFVDMDITNIDSAEGIILKVHERTTYLNRPPLANLTQVILVCTFKEPPLDLEAIDRFLLCASAYGLKPVIVFNKNDRIVPAEQQPFDALIAQFRNIGYTVLVTSASAGDGLADLLSLCKDHVSAFAGLSGVGKSALLKRIFPDREFRIGDVSGATGRGTHTTTTVTLIPLPGGGFIADTPGLAFVDLPQIPEEDVATYFPELNALIGRCRFNNCIHENEPGCTVRESVDKGDIAAWRVEHYLKIYREMKTRRREYRSKER